MNEAIDIHASSAATLDTRLARFALREVRAGEACVSYREAAAQEANGNEALPLVLLHGIGSGAASWVQQFEALGQARRVLAWDAPGYGASTPVASASPVAADYARVLLDWFDAVGVARCVLVGHSLGAIIAGAFAAAHPQRVSALLLISPADGYGAADPQARAEKRDARLAMLAELGPQGLAEKRSANMLSPHASDEARAWVRWNMARVIPHGYAQATHLLANADLAADLAQCAARVPMAVAVGAQDTITPPAACERLAQIAQAPFATIARAGHAGYIEQPEAYNALIDTFCRQHQPIQQSQGIIQK
ncbi:pimeloyl-ACP methyl ester carboxylesterase [Paraburkholderia bannensis]|uniref:Pimeloyl-ACP methyl ester carboxylesterase n=1 Tax=Paraburkholderia bannensis TaxID=765414 RepID=A0A7W9U3Z9_9BURK|nr:MULTISPECIES: alpha/beta fold hydrolase [Paraburkholderia]MBB3260676.1 pimeloyl-ACP methyl ester carboxylesterase [Paraburkholderia sp. WP4_3_2]MBB6105846.1 pimeloyl-ACP methyl ester carboxylesterase [Paraburkholderia bannensis]